MDVLFLPALAHKLFVKRRQHRRRFWWAIDPRTATVENSPHERFILGALIEIQQPTIDFPLESSRSRFDCSRQRIERGCRPFICSMIEMGINEPIDGCGETDQN